MSKERHTKKWLQRLACQPVLQSPDVIKVIYLNAEVIGNKHAKITKQAMKVLQCP